MVRHDTLPLFPTSEAPAPSGVVAPPVERRPGTAESRDRKRVPPRALEASSVSPHLVAARRLSRRMRRLGTQAEALTLTGRAICQHLRLLLEESERSDPH